MIYFSFYETLRTTWAMISFGAFFVVFDIFLGICIACVKNLPFLVGTAIKQNGFFSIIKTKFKADCYNRIYLFLKDFFSLLTFSIVFILLSYAFYDGIFRIYFLFLSLSSFAITKKLFGNKLKNAVENIFYFLLTIFVRILSVLIIPLNLSFKILKILFKPIKHKLNFLKSERLFKKKLHKISTFFVNSIRN